MDRYYRHVFNPSFRVLLYIGMDEPMERILAAKDEKAAIEEARAFIPDYDAVQVQRESHTTTGWTTFARHCPEVDHCFGFYPAPSWSNN